ncbi:uncharacterized protein LOC132273988 [Cornus florida]|uniref:uncharacterized protein LOC132273988 n=1 Tax=Cornus florida TaxID=4283 RepID=UPI00289D1C77|nr:uncharacterized protein LOC132273988 [Cornus florida]
MAIRPIRNGRSGTLTDGYITKRYVLLATDYFTKRVEVEAYASVTNVQVKKFIWNNLIYRFSVLRSIIIDNGPNLDNQNTQRFFDKYGINQKVSVVYHPQGNGQVEITNRTIFTCIKKKLEDKKGKWLDELPNVLWA